MAKSKKIIRKRLPVRARRSHSIAPTRSLLTDIRGLIVEARGQTARAVNTALVGLYWRIGKRIREDVLDEKRAEYGEQIVQTLSAQLAAEYGRGFSRYNLSRMLKMAEYFPDAAIVATLSQQLSWSRLARQSQTPESDAKSSARRLTHSSQCRNQRTSRK